MSYYKIINGLKWYYRLIPKKDERNRTQKGLFSDYPRHELTRALIVSWSYYDKNDDKIYRLYGKFKTYLEYGIYQMKLPKHERCFYEIALGEKSQKPHFDIDIDDPTVNGDHVKDMLVDSIISIIKIDLNDILIYTSHGNNKQSYHVIINNHCHANNIEAKAFYDMVVNNIPIEDRKWIDRAVYSPTQQFRIVGSSKIGSDRTKVFQKTWTYHDKTIKHEYPEEPDSPEHEFVMQLEESILGYTNNCRFLPSYDPKPEDIKHYDDIDDVTKEDAIEGLKLVAQAGNIKITDSKFPYKFMGINGPIVMLKRKKPSKCRICNRIHEHENPYLIIIGDEKNVYFHCRRAPEDKKLFLGKLAPKSDSDSDSDSVEENNVQGHVWARNVLERVKQIAGVNVGPTKIRHVTGETEVDPEVVRQVFK